MDREALLAELHSQDGANESIANIAQQYVRKISHIERDLLELIKNLSPVLTSSDYNVRLNGVSFLTHIIISLPKEHFSGKAIEVISEFLMLRLIDHKSMEQATLKCFSYFVECPNQPVSYNKNLVEFLRSKCNIRKMDAKVRRLVYEIIKKIVDYRRNTGKKIDGELVYSTVSLMESENNPENLILCFKIMSTILKDFNDVEPYIDDIFEWLSSYYPLEYTPEDNDVQVVSKILRSDLVQALYECFYATSLNADCLISMLLEKLDSNVMSTKMESLDCLIKCYEIFPLDCVKKYNSTLWTAIRSNCLRKIEMIDTKFFDKSLQTLGALAKKMAEDEELHFVFLSDMYEELAIAFRKPEMDLFEPAAKMVAHIIAPSIVGFHYVLDKILPISISAISANELRPMSGLAYILEIALLNNMGAKFKPELNVHIQRLIDAIHRHIPGNKSALRLLNSIVRNRFKIDDRTLEQIVSKIRYEVQTNITPDLECCLARICLTYHKFCLVKIDCADYSIVNLLTLIENIEAASNQFTIRIYFRSIIIILHDCIGSYIDDIGKKRLMQFLSQARLIAEITKDKRSIGEVAKLHAVILNKVSNDNVTPLVMDLFSSDYCQKLIPQLDNVATSSLDVYLPIISWSFKSLVIRNHELFRPLVNLLLNFIISDKIDTFTAISGSKTFSFILADRMEDSDELMWTADKNYQRFSLYKQKFHMQTKKEIRMRYEKEQASVRNKQLLLCCMVVQLPHLPIASYKSDIEWILRELVKTLSTNTTSIMDDSEELLYAIYECLTNLIQPSLNEQTTQFLTSLIELSLKYAREARTLRVRQEALKCLSNIATSFKHSELLIYRPGTIDKLRQCLVDKKRLVRQSAADARLKWSLIGQPIAS